MDLLVKDYLRTHTFRQLQEDHGVYARPNKDGDKFSLNYDMFESKNGDPISEQCRGLVVRPKETDWSDMMTSLTDRDWKDIRVGDVETLAWPMDRFYNHGDPAAAGIDWSHPSLKVYEKVDGTCIIVYWDRGHNKWHMATRSVPEADMPINAGNIEIGDETFAQLFIRVLKLTREEVSGKLVDWVVDGPDKVTNLNKELTYVFELVSPHNQIIVFYPKPRVYLLAARHTRTGKEVPIETLNLEHVRKPKTWEIRDVAALACFVDSADPSQLEGAVVCVQAGPSFSRLKVKNKAYVLAHKSKDTVTSSARNTLEAVILGKADDIIPLVPADVQEKLRNMQRAFDDYCRSIDERVAEYRTEASGSRKRFAEQVLIAGGFTAIYFNLWENRATNAREWLTAACKNNRLSGTSLDSILAKLAP